MKNQSLKSIDRKRKDLTYFSGKWQDNRTADEIIKDIYDSRRSNTRSERVKL